MYINLISTHIKVSERAVPLATAMLASSIHLYHPDIDINLTDIFLDTPDKEATELITQNNPDIIGFSIYLWNRTQTLNFIHKIKIQHPSAVIIVGGPEVTADYESFLQESNIDFVVPGEGENTIVSIIEQLKSKTPFETIKFNITNNVIEDVDTLPSPILDGTLNLQKSGLLWELSRGCPFNCSFCYESKGSNKIRRFSLERISKELDLISTSGVEEVFVLDPTFNYNQSEAKEILRLIAEKAPHIMFYFEIRSEFLDEEMVALFSQITCILQIGIQSIHPDVLETVNRSINIEDFENKVLMLHDAGIPYGFDIIYGLPNDNLKKFYRSLDFVMKLQPNHVDIFPLSILPGTVLAEKADEYKLNYNRQNPYLIINTPAFPDKEMKRAKKVAEACSKFYNCGKAVTWFIMICSNLKIKPSKFLLQFANSEFCSSEEYDVTTAQVKFIEQLFLEQEKTDFAMIAADIITYFAKLDEFLEDASTYEGNESESETFHLYYDPNALQDLIEYGVSDFKKIAKNLQLSPCNVSFKYLAATEQIDIIFHD